MALAIVSAAGMLPAVLGCLSERSFPIRKGDALRLQFDPRQASPAPASTRQWLAVAHRRLEPLLPTQRTPALLTDDLVHPDGQPIDVMSHHGRDPARLQKLFGNLSGLCHTAQCAATGYAAGRPQPWPGFEEVWIPVKEDLALCGWLGMAKKDGRVLESNCIVLLPGLLGCNEITRTRDLANALLPNGHHVLAIELRGHGQTDIRRPDVGYNFGVTETQDLMIVSEWLEARPAIRGTGMIGFCWGANQAMIAAWYDGRSADDVNLSPRQQALLAPPNGRRHFTAGVIAFSPVLRFEELIEITRTPRTMWKEPVYRALQDILAGRAEYKGYPERLGDLRSLIDHEYERSELNYPDSVEEGLTFLRLLPFRDKPAHEKMARVRIPTLVVGAANDPLVGGQQLADLIARVKNPMVAALSLPEGGHVGFAAWARRYYYSLIINFFDENTGPGAPKPPS